MGDELILKDEPGRRVVRVGKTVRRRTSPWTPAVHALLRHLEAVDFPYAPRVLGIDEQNREILSYIEGESGADGWAAIVPEDGLASFARLLRTYHDAVCRFHCPTDTVWAVGKGAPGDGELVCHNDFGPWNVVWRDGVPVGLLDWDFAAPGPAIDDVAYALEYAAPFRDDETALRWLRYERTPDRCHRIEIFAASYGLSSTAGLGDLVDHVARRQRSDAARVKLLAELGMEPQASWVAAGMLAQLEARAVWTEQHRALFEYPASSSASVAR